MLLLGAQPADSMVFARRPLLGHFVIWGRFLRRPRLVISRYPAAVVITDVGLDV